MRTTDRLLWLAALCACSCGRVPSEQVVVYVSTDPHIAQPVLEAFERQTGIDVLLVGDTEAKKTTGLVERLRAEQDAPVADVFWSSEAMHTVTLAQDGVLAEHDDDSLSGWPDAFRDPDGRWFGFSPRPRVIVYHAERMQPDDLPVTWEDAADPRWQDRVVLADPRFGTTGGHLGAMLAGWTERGQPERFDAMVEGLAANNARMLPGGNAAVVDAVLRGEADLGFTDADDVRAAQRRGLPVKMLYPRHDADGTGGGTFLMPNTVSIVEGAPNRIAAERLLAYLLSDDVARQLAESDSGNIPLSSEVAADYPDLIAPDPFTVDLGLAAARRADAVDRLLRALRATGTAP